MEDEQNQFLSKKMAHSSEYDFHSGSGTPEYQRNFLAIPEQTPTLNLMNITNSNITKSKSGYELKKSNTLGDHQLKPFSQRKD
jgi:hypothetical protein